VTVWATSSEPFAPLTRIMVVVVVVVVVAVVVAAFGS
jgi:hypothetical protein